jgi:hypothetical protein
LRLTKYKIIMILRKVFVVKILQKRLKRYEILDFIPKI